MVIPSTSATTFPVKSLATPSPPNRAYMYTYDPENLQIRGTRSAPPSLSVVSLNLRVFENSLPLFSFNLIHASCQRESLTRFSLHVVHVRIGRNCLSNFSVSRGKGCKFSDNLKCGDDSFRDEFCIILYVRVIPCIIYFYIYYI